MRWGWRSIGKSENPAKSMGLPPSGRKIGALIHNVYFGHWQTPVARSNEAKAGGRAALLEAAAVNADRTVASRQPPVAHPKRQISALRSDRRFESCRDHARG